MKDEYNKKADAKVKQVTKFGATVKRLRKEAGLSQEELTYKLGKEHRSFIAKIETGETKKMPSLTEIEKIAKALNVSIVKLLYNMPDFMSYKKAEDKLRKLHPNKEPNEREVYLYRQEYIKNLFDKVFKEYMSYSEEDRYNIFCWLLRGIPFAITLLSYRLLGEEYEQLFDRWCNDKDRIKRFKEARAKLFKI